MRNIVEKETPYRETKRYKRNAYIASLQNILQKRAAEQPGHTWADVPLDCQRPDHGEVTGQMSWPDVNDAIQP